MNSKTIDAVAAAADAVIRESKQPRLDPTKNYEFYYDMLYRWIKQVEIVLPEYRKDSRLRDKELIKFSKQEPLLDSVINTCVSIDQNRGWMMEGPERQVNKYTNILHAVEGGWRGLMMFSSSSFRRADVGTVLEVDRGYQIVPGDPIPAMINMFSVDPTKIQLRQHEKLFYYPPGAPKQEWQPWDYVRAYDDVALDESYNRLGYCMVSRCIEVAKLLIAIQEHEMEALLSKAPRGLLLLKNISQIQWNQAMTGSQEQMTEYERQFYNMLAVLATEGPDKVEAELVTLSKTPENFNKKNVIDMSMYAYALAAGYDPREFWPVSGGQMGTATETEVQHRKSTGKGAMNHIMQLQEQIQMNLPPSIDFEFEQRDVEGEMEDVKLLEAKIAVIAKAAGIMTTIKSSRIEKTDQALPDAGKATAPEIAADTGSGGLTRAEITITPADSAPSRQSPEEIAKKQKPTPGVVMTSGTETALSREEVRILLAEAGFIPRDWTEYTEETVATDTTTDPELEQLREKAHIRRAAREMPTEPIVRYSWPEHTIKVLFEEGQDALRRRYY